MIGITGELRRFAMQRVACQADDTEEARQALAGALLRPIEGRALRVRVDEDDALSLAGPFGGEMQRERRLADAALLVEQRDDHGALLGARGQLSAGVQTRMSVRKIPKESGLEKLRGLQAADSAWRFDDSGPR